MFDVLIIYNNIQNLEDNQFKRGFANAETKKAVNLIDCLLITILLHSHFLTFSFCPIIISLDLSLFHFFKFDMLTLYLSAMLESVSPFLTVW